MTPFEVTLLSVTLDPAGIVPSADETPPYLHNALEQNKGLGGVE
jgi:hypothetical protein